MSAELITGGGSLVIIMPHRLVKRHGTTRNFIPVEATTDFYIWDHGVPPPILPVGSSGVTGEAESLKIFDSLVVYVSHCRFGKYKSSFHVKSSDTLRGSILEKCRGQTLSGFSQLQEAQVVSRPLLFIERAHNLIDLAAWSK